MARPVIEPTTSRSRSGRSTICPIGTGYSAADLHLCFCICKKQVFSCLGVAYINIRVASWCETLSSVQMRHKPVCTAMEVKLKLEILWVLILDVRGLSKILYNCCKSKSNRTIQLLNEYWFTLRIITEELETIGNGMRPTGKKLTYSSGLLYLDTRNNQLIVIKTIQNLY